MQSFHILCVGECVQPAPLQTTLVEGEGGGAHRQNSGRRKERNVMEKEGQSVKQGEGMNRRNRERKGTGVTGAARGKGNRRKEADSKSGSDTWRSKEKR